MKIISNISCIINRIGLGRDGQSAVLTRSHICLYINNIIVKEEHKVTIVIVVAVAVVVGLIMFFAGTNKAKSDFEKTVGSAEKKSREIIDDAIRTAENKKREALL